MYYIREATVTDVETIRQLADKIWWNAYGPILEAEQISYMLDAIYSAEVVTSQISTGAQTFLLLIEEGDEQAVAFAAYSPREEKVELYKLHKLYCLPEKQGKGYGKALINEVVNKVSQAGYNTLDLNVNRYNKARFVYEKQGFEVIYEEDIPIGPYFMNDFVMRKTW